MVPVTFCLCNCSQNGCWLVFGMLRPDVALGVSLARWMCSILDPELWAGQPSCSVKDLHLIPFIFKLQQCTLTSYFIVNSWVFFYKPKAIFCKFWDVQVLLQFVLFELHKRSLITLLLLVKKWILLLHSNVRRHFHLIWTGHVITSATSMTRLCEKCLYDTFSIYLCWFNKVCCLCSKFFDCNI